MKISKRLTGIVICGFTVLALASFAGDRKNFEVSKNMDIFSSIYKELNQFYVDTIIPEKTLRIAIDSMLASLDPYTEYIPESEGGDLKFLATGEYGGIGSVISYRTRDKRIIINEPYEGQPADKAGLKAGDALLEINGIDLSTKTTTEASELLKGEVGTKIKLKVERAESVKPLVFEVERKKIQYNPVAYYGTVGKSTGYIYLSTFNGKTSSEVKKAFEDLKSKGITSLVLDLRGNTGGLLEEAVQVVNLFVPRGQEVLSTKGKIKQWDRVYRTTQSPIDTNIPLAVLVNDESASASEIVAGALQDMDRAVIVGMRTYGKGLVQSVRTLPYNGQLKLTTAKYYIPSGRCIQEIDYSHRKANGGAPRIADSLTTKFRTSRGRIVRDGGGVMPDFVNEPEKMRTISYYLLRDGHLLDYAARYLRHNTSIAAADQFALSEEAYADFGKYLHEQQFTYEKQSVRLLKELKQIADFEGYSEEAKEALQSLETTFANDLDKDLQEFKPEIKELLEAEIVKQYHYQKGVVIYSLKKDKDLKKAMEVLDDPALYKKTLNL
ncbi:MAG: S41 family peptidase [Bacteroidales bacterium]|jgi:carboxyl-terminal processing protease|nr:S41 family peptidase [Bacteroidales bacterium]MDD3160802.1 S41 family peptidase [Bacteroidales bacterium]